MTKSELFAKYKIDINQKKFFATVSLLVLVATVLAYALSSPIVAMKALDLRVPESVIATIYKNNPIVLYRLGNLNFSSEIYDIDKAQNYYQRAISLDNELPYLHYQNARIYFLKSRFQRAVEEVNLELEHNPDFARSYYLRGLIYGYDGQLELAKADFSKFIELKPREWAGYVDLSWVLFQMGDFDGMKRDLEHILPYTKNAWLLNSYGLALMNLGEFEKAKEVFEEAYDLASRMQPETWGAAYIGNDPNIYGMGLNEMILNIEENITIVDKRLVKN